MSGFKSKRQMAQDRFSTEVYDDRIIVRSIVGILLIIFVVALLL
jgi:hypothetical protein